MNLDDLQALAATIAATTDSYERQALQRQYLDGAMIYLRQLLAGSSQQVTADILRAFDALYDVSGMPTRLAEMIGWRLHDLQEALGRNVDLTCERCGTIFTVLETRRLGGYTRSPEISGHGQPIYCRACRRQVWENASQAWQNREDIRRQEIFQRARRDQQIRLANNPLELAFYRGHLQDYLVCWVSGEWTRALLIGDISGVPAGCMLCGNPDVHAWVTQHNRIDTEDRFIALLQHFDTLPRDCVELGVELANLDTYHQALWRLTPGDYFAYILALPLVAQPLLCLCHSCGWAVDGTHICLTPRSLDDRPLVSAA